MLDDRTRVLVQLAVYASRPEYHAELTAALEGAKEMVPREEVHEVFLQQYLFVGFPAALEGMKTLSKVWPSSGIQVMAEAMNYEKFVERGKDLYEQVYSRNADVVRKEMLNLSPDLAAWAVIEGYGKTLSRPGLEIKTRELCIVGILTQLGWKRQLFSHIMGAINVGATKEECAAAISIGCYEYPERKEKALRLLDKA
ncbi:MAG TPA: carboxymuconolactone decarboxylase family protein [Candidatus Kapabacteria bacterium]|nr:carboxymuconolactone decarboxylase family protein [Candidatus Kapabacteria bacterium]